MFASCFNLTKKINSDKNESHIFLANILQFYCLFLNQISLPTSLQNSWTLSRQFSFEIFWDILAYFPTLILSLGYKMSSSSVYLQVNTYRSIWFLENDCIKELIFPGKLVLLREIGIVVTLLWTESSIALLMLKYLNWFLSL